MRLKLLSILVCGLAVPVTAEAQSNLRPGTNVSLSDLGEIGSPTAASSSWLRAASSNSFSRLGGAS